MASKSSIFNPNNQIQLISNYKAIKEWFTEQKLYELTHHTDDQANPYYDAYKNDCVIDLRVGAKGIGKTFIAIIECLYDLVHEENYNPFMFRNFYKHIKGTIKASTIKAILLIQKLSGVPWFDNFVDCREQIDFYNGERNIPQTIYYGNWENVQAIQGFTLPHPDFYIRAILIDEPIEDPNISGITDEQLQEIYEIQASSIDLVYDNTIFREGNKFPKGKRAKAIFCYNPFDDKNFLINKYQNQVCPYSSEVISEIVDHNFYQISNKQAEKGLGVIWTAVSRLFPPKSTISDDQRSRWMALKEANPRLYQITIAGVPYLEQENNDKYYLHKFIYKDDENYRHDWIYHKELAQEIKNGRIIGICDGLDAGVVDATAMCRVSLDVDGNMIIYSVIAEILRKDIKRDKRMVVQANNEQAISIMRAWDNELGISKIDDDNRETLCSSPFQLDYTPTLLTDNRHMIQALVIVAHNQNYPLNCYMAIRKDGNNPDTNSFEYFGIENRQKWWISQFESKKIYFTPECEYAIKIIAEQVIPAGEEKRDEKINPKIYDLINAIEYAISGLYRLQAEQIVNKN